MAEHKVNEDYDSIRYVYRLGKGECNIGNLNLNDIKGTKTLSGNTALHIAARYGINEVVKKIAESDIRYWFYSENWNKDKAYHVAARNGHISTVQTLLAVNVQHLHDIGADELHSVRMLTDRNEQGNTIFHEALINVGPKGAAIFEALASPVKINDGEGVKSLSIEIDVYGEDVAMSVNNEGKTPLYLAIEFGYKRIVERLLTNCKGNPKGKSPILAAIFKGDKDMLHIILNNKAEWVQIEDGEGLLPLHHAAYVGHLDAVCLLLNKCPSCTLIKDKKKGRFPLHMASYGGHVEVFKKLLSYCLDPYEMLNDRGQNVLHIAAQYGNHEMVRHILRVPELKNMINKKDKDGNTPLHLAARFSHLRVVHTLTWNKGIDLTVVNNEKKTALEVAAYARLRENATFREKVIWNALRSAVRKQSRFQRLVNATESSNKVSAESEKASLEGESSNNVPAPSKEGSLVEKFQNQGASNDASKQLYETLIVVSTLIVTLTFAAGIQFPGGSNENGQAKLLHKRMFQIYILNITVSMHAALIALVMLLLARLGDDMFFLLALDSAFVLLGLTLVTLSLAFSSAVYLIISKLTWLVTICLVMSFVFPYTVLLVYGMFMLLSFSALPILRTISYYPFRLYAWLDEKRRNVYSFYLLDQKEE